MKLRHWCYVFILPALLISACAHGNKEKIPEEVFTNGPGNYVPAIALTDGKESISIPHPVEYERQGIEKVTTFDVVMDPALFTEVIQGGGVFPVIGEKDGKVFKGIAYLLRINWWGDNLIRIILAYSVDDLKGVKFLLFNRDAGYAFSLGGQEVLEAYEPESPGNSGNNNKIYYNPYNPEKFDKDKVYRAEFLNKYGTSLDELENLHRIYRRGKTYTRDFSVYQKREIRVGSTEWDSFTKEIKFFGMNNDYTMYDDEIRIGHLPLEDFRRIAVESPDFKTSQRFFKRVKIPINPMVFTGLPYAVSAGANMLTDLITAGIDDDWTGVYARAKTIRYKYAPTLRRICFMYKRLIAAHDLYWQKRIDK